MRAVVQRVRAASVRVEGSVIAEIGTGMLILLGVARDDTPATAARLAAKVAALRIFDDLDGRMNRSVREVSGEALCVSQFTLFGDVRRGNRPSYEGASPGSSAMPIYEAFCSELESLGVPCQRGQFGAEMLVELANDGPVTLILDTELLDQPRRA